MSLDKMLGEILVPRADNAGNEYPLDYHHAWDEQVRSVAGGLTILRTAKGHWVSPEGKLFAEPMIPVRMLCTEEQLHSIAELTMQHYGQEAVLAYKISDKIVLLHRKDITH